MKLYLAAVYTSSFHKTGQAYARLDDREKAARDGVKYILESYHYINKELTVGRIRQDNLQIFLDSGAFSAFSLGVDVDIEAYCRYIQKNEDIILKDDGKLCASVLDGIGDPLLTYQNQKTMESLGVTPLPCFHYGEDERYLEYYIENYEYITLGGMVPISTPQLIHWLDRIWDQYLTDGSGRARLKVHGFGLTSLPLMERYPWYSVDSSSWQAIGSNGSVMLSDLGTLPVSVNSPAAKQYNRHLDTLPELQRQALVERFTREGFDVDRLRDSYLSRWAYNCWSFGHMNETLLNDGSDTFKDPQIGLFDD